MNNFVILLYISLLTLNSGHCQSSVNSPGSGGSANGDPAPGRSPGPPEVTNNEHGIEDDHPTILLTSDRNDVVCNLQGTVRTATEDVFNVTIFHQLFKTDVLVPGVTYQIIVTRKTPGPPTDFSITSSIDGEPSGEFTSFQDHNCGPHIFRSYLKSPELLLNWTLHDNKEFRKSNVTFLLHYSLEKSPFIYTSIYMIPILQDCQLHLIEGEAVISNKEIPHISDCQVWFPTQETGHGLVIELTRLNVPCSRGFIHFSGLNITQHQHFRSHKQTHLCGKLEELPESERRIYFPPSYTQPFMHLHGNPIFSVSYHLVDYCYNITFVTRNGSFELKPSGNQQCTFRIHLPYGYRVALKLRIGDSTSTGSPETSMNFQDTENGDSTCDGLLLQLQDGDSIWSHCTKPGDAERHIEIVSRGNKVVLKVIVRGTSENNLGLRMSYHSEPVESVAGVCEFGWVVVRQFCVSAIEGAKLPWAQAEMECARKGGHLASIRSDQDQIILDNLLLNSPAYHDHNAYWIGASDKSHEGDFRWSDGLPFSYTNWFPGWTQYGHYNKQPNDDGLSDQDCVEVRRVYSLPSSSVRLASTFKWNDRDCSTPNYFICERLQNDEPLENNWIPECNRSVFLSRDHPKTSVSSPGFPRQYPDNINCDINIVTSPGYRIILDFEELVVEDEPSCSYDYLAIIENTSNSSTSNNSVPTRRLCGDWSSKLKLLRYISQGSKLKLRFSSDYSHHYGGFKARVSMENAMQCSDDRLHMFNNFCYLIVSYPEATWNVSQQICDGLRATLASVLTPEEERFITTNIRKTTEYRTGALYWLGARAEVIPAFKWIDGNPMNYSGWLSDHVPTENDMIRNPDGISCLSMQWQPSTVPTVPSGLYWKAERCDAVGGYICKRRHELLGSGIYFNKTLNDTEGMLNTPNYPGNYYNSLDFSVKISGPDRTRIIVKFEKIDIESQLECLYDYVELKTIYKNKKQINDAVKWCGTHDTDMRRFNFVSETNELEVTFHSDYSVSGSGFSLSWRAVDVSMCPLQTLTAKEGVVTTPNYPDFLLAHLDCTITILASAEKRIWLDFLPLYHNKTRTDYEANNHDVTVELKLGKQSQMFKPFETAGLLTEGSFVSTDESLKLIFRTGDHPQGAGFRVSYKVLSAVKEEKVIHLSNHSSGLLLHLNYPNEPPANVDFLHHFLAPLGSVILLELYYVKLSDTECPDGNGVIQVYDNYSDANGTSWRLCYDSDNEKSIIPAPPIYITSFLNTLHLRQKHGAAGISFNGTLRVQLDENYRKKLISYKDRGVESCIPNPCQNGGKCLTKKFRKFCQCVGQYTGLFCALTKCELKPCAFGTCELTNTSYKCHCKAGYLGPTCDQKRKPCEGNPCESRGTCIERGDGFLCQCHAWWEGPRCEKRMLHIPYKPLSERMLHEPFWLGLMTVFVVMGIIGLVWCAKRHFPEKIEKLLAEEDSRNRSTISSLRSASVREQLAAAAAGTTVTITPSPGPGAPRSLFGRLGIRKPSILSLTSPHAGGYVPATARTFSLDDLLKPPLRRTPSPKKKRNNSTPTKKNAAEKKQILQQLISPMSKQNQRKVSLGELIQLSDIKRNEKGDTKQENAKVNETMFGDNAAQAALNDPKLEKKVTFARLLNKVSAEMSSGSEIELGIMQTNKLGCMFARPSSTPPSPNIDVRSPNSTSSNQGSDSLTSSDLAIPSALSSSISDLLINRRSSSKFPTGRQKPASADSILAMFRNFSSSSAGANLPSSLKVSPSSTPTASSPQDDIVGDDESSTSSIHTPVSFSSGNLESPIMQRHSYSQSIIEVPVLDPLSAHKTSTSGNNLLQPPTILLEIPSTINKCLSPIREMPTPLPSPMPSPALTPIMRRSMIYSSVDEADTSDDKISIELPNISVSCNDDEDGKIRFPDRAIDLQAEDGLILEEAAAMHHSALLKSKKRPPPIGHPSEEAKDSATVCAEPVSIIIPTLTIQTPSPTHCATPSALFPGSPPPHRSQNEPCFQFPSPKQNRKIFKDFDKPASLDLPCIPPMITITCNMSEVESDTESISPAVKSSGHLGVASSGMTYLSPFSMSNRGDHTASESNLSSSGYSSMASPGPSRCSSSNPLCPTEMEDQGPPGLGGSKRRQSLAPTLKLNCNTPSNNVEKNTQNQRRGRSDSETLSDDPLLESNDEGIGTDHIDEKIDEGEVKSAKELEVFMVNENDTSKTFPDLPIIPKITTPRSIKCVSLEAAVERLSPLTATNSKNSLQLPSIVVQCDSPGCDKHLSPMSSRSESPLSDRTTGVERFSPQFYGKHKDVLPFTDSDGLYDFPSSDKVNVTTSVHHKKIGRKREKKMLRNCKTPSPTKSHQPTALYSHLDIPSKDSLYKVPPPRKLSPKRRVTRSQVVSSSSSSDSITSTRENRLSSSSPNTDTIRWSSPLAWMGEKYLKSPEKSQEEICEDVQDVKSGILPNTSGFSNSHFTSHQKISRLRTISHQIRFLKRLEQNIKRRERTVSPSDSDSGEESPGATSPLLQPSKGSKVEICKSNSSSKLQSNINPNKYSKRGKCKREPLLQEKSLKLVISAYGHSD